MEASRTLFPLCIAQLPAAAARLVEEFEPDARPKLLLDRRRGIQAEMDRVADAYHALKAQRDSCTADAQAACRHYHCKRESDGDFHRASWEYRCVLCGHIR